jgi:hypothetical protein
VSNHISWWDTFVIAALSRRSGLAVYGLMDAAQLERYPYFAMGGALPVDRERPGRVRRDLRRAVELLDRPGRALWIFGTGRQAPVQAGPVRLEAGYRILLQLWMKRWRGDLPLRVVPVGLDFVFLESEKPEIWVSLGEPTTFGGGTSWDAAKLTEAWRDLEVPRMEARIEAELERIRRGLRGEEAFDPLWHRPARERQEGLPARLLASWARRLLPGER